VAWEVALEASKYSRSEIAMHRRQQSCTFCTHVSKISLVASRLRIHSGRWDSGSLWASEVVESEEVRFLETEDVAASLLVEMRTTLRSYDHWHKKKKKFRFFFGGVLRGRLWNCVLSCFSERMLRRLIGNLSARGGIGFGDVM